MAKKSSKKGSNKKGSKKSDSKTQKSKIDEKDKKFIITLISVLIVMAVLVLAVYNQTGPYNSENKKDLTDCPTGSGNAEVCTQEYAPVCGYNPEGKQMGTYSNDCNACKNESVASYSKGKCSK